MKKYWGSLNLDEIGKAVKAVPDKYKDTEKYGKQLTVDATIWDDGNISISVYNKETKERYKVGNLRVSSFQNDGGGAFSAPTQDKTEGDLPF